MSVCEGSGDCTHHQRTNAVGVMASCKQIASYHECAGVNQEFHFMSFSTNADIASTSFCLRMLKHGIPASTATRIP